MLGIAASSLSGCVAAALPIIAGGAIARSQSDGEAPDRAVIAKAEEPAAASATSVENTTPAGALARPIQTPVIDRSIQSPLLAQFIRYSTQQAYRYSEVAEALPSAVLRDPAALDGERIPCEPGEGRDPAVLIDLDPGDDVFSAASPLPTSTAIALSLKVLRSEGVTIAWASANSAADADIIRDALTTSGLDPDAEDTLLLMRYPGDRKQTRRKEFASETCLMAIAGDNRRDFDELFDYLTSRDAAFKLEKLINNGWFLIGPDTPVIESVEETVSDETESNNPAEVANAAPATPTPDGKQQQ